MHFAIYRKIPNISTGLIAIFKHIWGALYLEEGLHLEGLHLGGLYLEGFFHLRIKTYKIYILYQ